MTSKGGKRLRAVILPKSEVDSYSLALLAHPRTRVPTRYLKTAGGAIYELTEIAGEPGMNGGRPRPRADEIATGKARSLLFTSNKEEGTSYVLEEGKIVVSTPISPFYFALGLLYDSRDQFLTADNLHDLLESEKYTPCGCSVFTQFEAFKTCITPFCDNLNNNGDGYEGFFKFSPEKLFTHLDKIVSRIVVHGLPADIHRRIVIEALTPPTLDAEIPKDLLDLAVERTAMYLVSSNIPVDLSDMYLATRDFTKLDEHLQVIKTQKQVAQQQQQALAQQQQQVASRKRSGALDEFLADGKKSKTAAPKTRGERVLAKVDKSSMKSITSFFKPAAKK